MKLSFERMTDDEARQIAAWKYEPPYDFYDIEELLGERGDYFSAFSGGELVGYFCFGAEARVPGGEYTGEALDTGLGMRPNLTGRGLGRDFLDAGLAFAGERFSPAAFRLTVAAFNERARTVYERAGFEKVGEFTRKTNDGEDTFITMSREN